MYAEFAQIYDALMDGYDYERWARYYQDCCRRFGGRFQCILEFGAGTGNMTKLLAKSAREIVAVDASEDMLSMARQKLSGVRNVLLLTAEMQSFKVEKSFDMVVSACDAMNYLMTEEDLLSAFRSAYQCLNKSGIFVFDLSSVYKLSEMIGNRTFVYDTEDIFYCWENSYSESEKTLSMTIHFFKHFEGNRYERIVEEQVQRGYEADMVLKLLRQVGFLECYAFEPFTFEACRSKSERIAFVGKK